MKTIILSAGKGERLLPLTRDRPKLLIDLGDGSTLLSRQYENLTQHPELGDLIIGAGHCVTTVDKYSENLQAKVPIKIIYNPFYANSGPLVTLWITLKNIIDPDFMFMNGDTIYSSHVYDSIVQLLTSSLEGIFLFCSTKDNPTSDDIVVKLDDMKNICEANKRIEGSSLISAGLVIVKGKNSADNFRTILDQIARTPDFLNYEKTWHSFIKDLASAGKPVTPIIVEKQEWMEIDIHFELQELQNILIHKVADIGF